jgi:ribosomal protein L40E
METELGEVGKFVLEKQCRDLEIDPKQIEGRHIPRLSRILSGIMSRFGSEKSRRIDMALNNLRLKELEDEEVKDVVCWQCKTQVSPDSESCTKCGADLADSEETPQLFSKKTLRIGSPESDVTITDVSARSTKSE